MIKDKKCYVSLYPRTCCRQTVLSKKLFKSYTCQLGKKYGAVRKFFPL
ncbi:hypothetical protein pdam_00002523 [Pocillopora damicornis]|uniref:Uncharacterized protein n=1 Tax=Pocillopora damicornis TaxID=46731 RepID=A0A3M6TS87_POCDA|nr:hypothetical protein pdam_00002523 [Pocillopora damicornis]